MQPKSVADSVAYLSLERPAKSLVPRNASRNSLFVSRFCFGRFCGVLARELAHSDL
jgi:hypothetical protein